MNKYLKKVSLTNRVAVKKIANTRTAMMDCLKVRGLKFPAAGSRFLLNFQSGIKSGNFDVRKHRFCRFFEGRRKLSKPR